MRTIKVKKETLLIELRNNRTSHSAAYTKAIEGWRMEAALTINANRVKLGTDMATLEKTDPLPEDFSLASLERIDPMPRSYLKDYDRAIQMLEMHVDDTIELEEHEFRQFVQDEWDWKSVFTASNSKYLGK